MTIQITGKQMDVGAALRENIETRIQDAVEKHFGRPSSGHVTLHREGHGFRADCSLHLASGTHLQASGEGDDAHKAFDDALNKIEKRLRRYKRRLRDHSQVQRAHAIEEAKAYVIREHEEPENDTAAEPVEDAPIIIAETQSQVKTLSVSSAVMEMELADLPALMFRNTKTGRLNMVHKRKDGNVAWIDPAMTEAKVEPA